MGKACNKDGSIDFCFPSIFIEKMYAKLAEYYIIIITLYDKYKIIIYYYSYIIIYII